MSHGVPRFFIRFNVAVQVLAIAVLLGVVNYFSFNHYVRADYSRSQHFVLTDQTKQVLRELKKPVKIFVFFSPTSNSPETGLNPDVHSLLRELTFSGRKKVEVEYIDPTRDLSRARELQARYKFSADENVVILDYDGRTKIIRVSDMADFDMTPLQSGGQPKLVTFKGEQYLTNGMISLISPETKKIYFLQGHGEPSIDGITPLRVFKDYLTQQNTNVQPLSLASIDSIPPDCTLLVIIAPQADLTDREAAIIEQYWAGQQGRLLVLLDPAAKVPRLDALLGGAGIIPRDDRVLRVVPLSPTVTGILRDVTAEFLPKNPITRRLVGMDILLTGATQSLNLDVAQAKKVDVQLWPLVQAAEAFWGESEYAVDESKGVRYDEGKDTGQPVYVAAAAARGGVNDERVEVDSSKLLVVGSSQFALDASLDAQGHGLDFLLSACNWLLERRQLTGVMPKTVQHFTLNLTDDQLEMIALYTLIIIPGLAALLGIVAWFRRRS